MLVSNRIIVNIQIDYHNHYSLMGHWEKFTISDDKDIDLFIHVSSHLMHKYGIDILEPQPGCAVLK